MHSVVISGTGIYQPPYTITNAELVEAFNRYVDQENARLADEIAAGVREPLTYSSVEFIEKASGIKQRYVLEKSGVLDPSRMYPRFTERPDDQLSLMAEIAVDAARKALDAAGKTGDQIDAVLCSAANMQRAYPAMAIEIQQALGASGYGFDMNVACSSATFAIEQAVNAVRTGSAKCVLVVNPEITSGHHEWRDRDCHFIFGDVCTAVIVERADCATSAERSPCPGSLHLRTLPGVQATGIDSCTQLSSAEPAFTSPRTPLPMPSWLKPSTAMWTRKTRALPTKSPQACASR